MTALLLLKYSVLLATISQRVKARRASKKEGKCDNEINPGPAGPFRARQAEHDVLQPPRPGGRAARPGGAMAPKMPLVALSGVVSMGSPSKCYEGTVEVSGVPPGRLSIPWAPASPPGRGCFPPCPELLQSQSHVRDLASPWPCRGVKGWGSPQVSGTLLRVLKCFCILTRHDSQALHNHKLALMMERQIYDAKEQLLEPREDCGWGFNNPAVSPELAL